MSRHSSYCADLLNGRVVIVTGGGARIGRCTAREPASLGATIAIVRRKP